MILQTMQRTVFLTAALLVCPTSAAQDSQSDNPEALLDALRELGAIGAPDQADGNSDPQTPAPADNGNSSSETPAIVDPDGVDEYEPAEPGLDDERAQQSVGENLVTDPDAALPETSLPSTEPPTEAARSMPVAQPAAQPQSAEPISPALPQTPEQQIQSPPTSGPILGLPTVSDPRVALARETQLIALISQHAGLLKQIHDSGQAITFIQLLQSLYPEDTQRLQLYQQMFTTFVTQNAAAAAFEAAPVAPASIADDLDLQAVTAEALAPEPQITPPLELIPDQLIVEGLDEAPPTLMAPLETEPVSIIPITARLASPTGASSDRATISVARRHYILTTGQTAETPAGRITLLRIDEEESAAGTQLRVIIEHDGIETSLPWSWESRQ